jgi:transcriptional antiterminator RfaH
MIVWSVAAIRPNLGAVDLALRNLERQHFPTFMPTVTTRRVVRNRVREVQLPAFMSYVFIQIDLDDRRWTVINSTFGIRRILTHRVGEYDQPSVISDSFIDGLRCCCERADERADERAGWHKLKVGTTVRITSGPFASHDGVITSWAGEDRLRLLLWLLNRSVKMTIWAGAVAPVEAV